MKTLMKNILSLFTDKNCDGKFSFLISNINNDGIKKIFVISLSFLTYQIIDGIIISDFNRN